MANFYRPSDPRFQRRLNEIGQSVEHATESAQSGLYIFGERYVRPCFQSIGSCLTTCVDASCPSLNLSQRDRIRRQRGRGRSRGRAELSFDFYDDWDDLDEQDGLLGWGGNEDFDHLVAGSGAGYGTVSTQPQRQRGMSYPKARRKSAAQIEGGDATVIPGTHGGGFFGKLFGGKALRYKPSAADLQEHPGARRLGRDRTEGEALLEESEEGGGRGARRHGRTRSGTAGSGETTDSFSSRGDIFPSDEELDDAIPLDDEFAMVLERRNTQSGPETESSSGRARSDKRGKRPSAGSRASTRRTLSLRSERNSTGNNSRRGSNSAPETIEDAPEAEEEIEVPTMSELKQEEQRLAAEEDAAVERKRQEAQKIAAERGLPGAAASAQGEELPSKEATPKASSPVMEAMQSGEEPTQLPTPLSTDDGEGDGDAPSGKHADTAP